MENRMNRETAIERAHAYFDDGTFESDLARRVAIPTESQNADRADAMHDYLEGEMRSALEGLGYTCRFLDNPDPRGWPLLAAERIEDEALPSVFTYGHGDVIRGQDASWHDGLSPWELTRQGDRLYGRGTADNKGQHTPNEHLLAPLVREGLGIMTGLFWDLGEEGIPERA